MYDMDAIMETWQNAVSLILEEILRPAGAAVQSGDLLRRNFHRRKTVLTSAPIACYSMSHDET